MSGPILGAERQYDQTQYQDAFNQVQVSSDRVFGAAFHEAYLDNPLPSLARMAEIDDATGRVVQQGALSGPVSLYESLRRESKGKPIAEEDFNKSFAQLGLKWDPNMTEEIANILGERKRRELRNIHIMNSGKGGLPETVGKFGVSMVAGLLDPVNVALNFIPVVGEGKFAAWALKHGKTKARIARGAIEGFTGSMASEPFAFAARTQEQADYTAMNSLYNVLVGTALGSGLHVVTGKIGDVYMERVKATKAHLDSVNLAAKQMADGKVVDVDALHAANQVEIMKAKTGVSDEFSKKSTINISELRAGLIPEHVAVQKGARFEVRFRDEQGTLKNMVGRGLSEEEALRDLVSNYEVAFRPQERAEVAATRYENLKEELQQLLDEKNQIEGMRKDPDYINKRLAERGVPVETLNKLREQIAAREAQRPTLSQKKLKRFDEETEVIKQELRELGRKGQRLESMRVRRNVKEATEPRLTQIDTRIKEISKQMDVEYEAKVKDTLAKQEQPTSYIEHVEDTPPTEIRQRESEDVVESLEKDIKESEEMLKELLPEDTEFKSTMDEVIKSAEARAKALTSAISCMSGKI